MSESRPGPTLRPAWIMFQLLDSIASSPDGPLWRL
jgi:hypothetical protein